MVLGIDPALAGLNAVSLLVRRRRKSPRVLAARVVRVSQLAKLRGQRRLRAVSQLVLNEARSLLDEHGVDEPEAVFLEEPFLSPFKRVLAHQMELVKVIHQMEVDCPTILDRPAYLIHHTTAKKAVTGNGGSKKDAVRRAVKQSLLFNIDDETKDFGGKQRVKAEEAICDSAAVAFGGYSAYLSTGE